ncbi:MAG: patatin-like phospholipase family protein [Syntrophaceae bacterium]
MKHRRPRVGIALDSGGAKGAAHVGVLDVLIENDIPVDIIAGSSAGAFAGALFATGTLEKFKTIIDAITWRESLSYYVDPVFPFSGLLAGKRARAFVHDIVGDVNIEDLAPTFTAVATDLLSGETVAIDTGPLVDAVMASVSMPGIFKPVVLMDRLLTDGGVTDPLPLDILKRSSPDITIAVNLHPSMPNRYDQNLKKALIREQKQQIEDEDLPSWIIDRVVKVIRSQKIMDNFTPLAKGIAKKFGREGSGDVDLAGVLNEQLSLSKDKLSSLLQGSFIDRPKQPSMNIFEILTAATNIQQYQKNRLMLVHEPPDVLIEPEVGSILSLEFVRSKEAIDAGRRSALELLPHIKSLVQNFR